MASDLDALGHHQQLVGMQRVLLPAEVRDRECGDILAGPRKMFFPLTLFELNRMHLYPWKE